MRFPLPFVPKITYKGGNGFGGNRDKVRKGLRHAANDLAAEPGTPVLAMCGGQVVGGPYPFFMGTYAIEVKHPDFIARYCEIDKKTEVKSGDEVAEGQVIAYVGDQPGQDMLHLEFFAGTAKGDLSTKAGARPPYDRREDVFDGSKYLDQATGTVTHSDDKTNKYRYDIDKKGRKFVQKTDLRDI